MMELLQCTRTGSRKGLLTSVLVLLLFVCIVARTTEDFDSYSYHTWVDFF